MSGNLLVTHTLDSEILHQAVNGTFRKPRNFFFLSFHLCSRYLPSYLMSFFSLISEQGPPSLRDSHFFSHSFSRVFKTGDYPYILQYLL